jgi:hypothetical protein
MQNRSKNSLEMIDDNTFYRLMNNSLMNWRKLLMRFAKQFVNHVKSKGEHTSGVTCYVFDDIDIEKTGKTSEFVGRILTILRKN